MISLDANILLPAVESRNAHHAKAAAFLESLQERQDVAICEFILLELYVLLRNPAVLAKPHDVVNRSRIFESQLPCNGQSHDADQGRAQILKSKD